MSNGVIPVGTLGRAKKKLSHRLDKKAIDDSLRHKINYVPLSQRTGMFSMSTVYSDVSWHAYLVMLSSSEQFFPIIGTQFPITTWIYRSRGSSHERDVLSEVGEEEITGIFLVFTLFQTPCTLPVRQISPFPYQGLEISQRNERKNIRR